MSEGQDQILGYIYVATNVVNGKKYVGQTCVSLERRWAQHLSAARNGSNYALHGALRKYGASNFKVEVCEEVDGLLANLLSREVHHIHRLGSSYPQGYNLTSGGEGLDWSNPVLRERHLVAVRKSSSKESWKKAQRQGAQKRLSNPEWQKKNREALSSLHSSPQWRSENKARWKAFHSDPLFQKKLAEGILQRSEGSWKENHKSAMQKLHSDEAFQKKRDLNMQCLNEKRSQEALLRDAQYPPEEAARRQRKREQRRLRRAQIRLENQNG